MTKPLKDTTKEPQINPIDGDSIRNIYDNCWQNRKFELENLWQRSIFLATFLVLIFTGYGILMMKFSDALGSYDGADNREQQLLFLNFCAILLSLVGIFLSTLWILMGKSSKAWYERYQNAVRALEKMESNVHTIIHPKNGKRVGTFNCHELPDFRSATIDYNVLTTNGGAYSTSRINIAIGQITLFMWLFIFLAHIIWICTSLFDLGENTHTLYYSEGVLAIFSVAVIVYFFRKVRKTKWLTSKGLEKQLDATDHR